MSRPRIDLELIAAKLQAERDVVEELRKIIVITKNTALEEAAHKATSFLVGDPKNGVPLRSPSPHQIADAIRSLKEKTE